MPDKRVDFGLSIDHLYASCPAGPKTLIFQNLPGQ
jgi:hypothetical protein